MAELWQKSAGELAALIRSRKASAREATESALGRLAKVNPAINAVVMEMPDEALTAARLIDERLARGGGRGPARRRADHHQGERRPVRARHQQRPQDPARPRGRGGQPRGRQPAQGRCRHHRAHEYAGLLAALVHAQQPARPHPQSLGPRHHAGRLLGRRLGVRRLGHRRHRPRHRHRRLHPLSGLRLRHPRPAAVAGARARRQLHRQGPPHRRPADGGVGPARAHHRRRAARVPAMAAGDGRDPWWTPVPLDLGPAPKRAALTVAPDG